MNDEEQDSKTIYSFAWIDFFFIKYITFALLKLLSFSMFCPAPNRVLQ